MPRRGRATARHWGETAVDAHAGRGRCEAVGARVLGARGCGWSREPVATPVVTGLALLPCGSIRPRRRSRPHGRGRSAR
jgi:hypothetical protein